MATRTVVCPECESPLSPGRFSCSACGALVASVASVARSFNEPDVLASVESEPEVAPTPRPVQALISSDDGWDEVRDEPDETPANGRLADAVADDLPLASAMIPGPEAAAVGDADSADAIAGRGVDAPEVHEAAVAALEPAATAPGPATTPEADEPAWPDHPTWPLPTVDPRTPPPVLGLVGGPEDEPDAADVDDAVATAGAETAGDVASDPRSRGRLSPAVRASCRRARRCHCRGGCRRPRASLAPPPSRTGSPSRRARLAGPSGLAESLNSLEVPGDAGSRTIAIGGGDRGPRFHPAVGRHRDRQPKPRRRAVLDVGPGRSGRTVRAAPRGRADRARRLPGESPGLDRPGDARHRPGRAPHRYPLAVPVRPVRCRHRRLRRRSRRVRPAGRRPGSSAWRRVTTTRRQASRGVGVALATPATLRRTPVGGRGTRRLPARPARFGGTHQPAWTRSSARSATRSAASSAARSSSSALRAIGDLPRHPVARRRLLGVPRHAAAVRQPDPAVPRGGRRSSCSPRSSSSSRSGSTRSSGRTRRSARSGSGTWPRRRSSPRSRRSTTARPASGAIDDEWIICPTCRTRLNRVCPNCSRLVGLDWSLCAWCGKDFERREVPAAVARPSPAPITPLPGVDRRDRPPRDDCRRRPGRDRPARRASSAASAPQPRRMPARALSSSRPRPSAAADRRVTADAASSVPARPTDPARPGRPRLSPPAPARPGLHVHHRGPRGPGAVRRRLAGHAPRPRRDRSSAAQAARSGVARVLLVVGARPALGRARRRRRLAGHRAPGARRSSPTRARRRSSCSRAVDRRRRSWPRSSSSARRSRRRRSPSTARSARSCSVVDPGARLRRARPAARRRHRRAVVGGRWASGPDVRARAASWPAGASVRRAGHRPDARRRGDPGQLCQRGPRVSPLPPTGRRVGARRSTSWPARSSPRSARRSCSAAFATTAWARVSGARRGARPGRPVLRRRPRAARQRRAAAARRSRSRSSAFAARMPVALALGWLFRPARSIWAPIGLHAAFNGDPARRSPRSRARGDVELGPARRRRVEPR